MVAKEVPFTDLLSKIVDNRGRTCPVVDAGFPLIATNCVRNEFLYPAFENIRYVSDETYHSWFRGHPEPGDIIFVCKGSPGRVCITPDPVNFCIAQDMVAVRADPEKVYPRYLFALLRSPSVQNQIGNMHVGTLIPHFKKGDFSKLLLPVPDNDTQKAIGDFYFEMSSLIDQLQRMNETLESTVRTLFKSWFVDFDPVRAKMEGFPPAGIDVVTADLFTGLMENTSEGDLPQGWRYGPVYDLCKVRYGAPYASRLFNTERRGYPLVRIRDLTSHNPEIFTEETHPAGFTVEPGELLVGMDGEFRAQLWLGPVAVVNQRVCKFIPNAQVSVLFLRSAVEPGLAFFERAKVGTTVIHLGKGDIDTMRVIVPPSTVLERFNTLTNPFLKLICSNAKEMRTLTETRDALLPRLISGEVPARDCARIVRTVV